MVLLAGCKLDFASTEDVTQLRQAISAQQKEIQNLKASHDALNTEIAAVKADTAFNALMLNLQSAEDTAALDLTDKSFSVVKTRLGIFLVSVTDVVPFANGVKLKIDVGNPQAMTYSGLNLKAYWSKGASNDSSTQTKEFDLPQTFQSGTWNKAEVVLSPAKVDDIDNVRVSIRPNQVRLQVAR